MASSLITVMESALQNYWVITIVLIEKYVFLYFLK